MTVEVRGSDSGGRANSHNSVERYWPFDVIDNIRY